MRFFSLYSINHIRKKEKMLKKFSLMFVLLLFLALPLVAADFSIESQLETNTVCPSNTIIINEIISSTTDASYSVSVSGSAAQFTTAVPSGFFLQAGQKQTVFLYITPSSKITPGSYSLTFQVTSQGVSKTVSHSIIVENCHATTVIVQPVSQQACTCEEKSFKLTIKNNGKYLESYTLSAEGPLSSYTTFSTKTFSLSPEQTMDITAYIKAPCNMAGDYSTTFKVNAGSRYAQTETTASLKLIPCYDYSFEVEKNLYETCENQKTTIPITINNLGTQDNSYTITLDAPAWISVDQKTMKVTAGQEKVFNMIMQPPLNTIGNFTSIVKFVSDKGTISQNLNLDVHVGSCYGSTLAFQQKQDTICNGLSGSYIVLLKNTGKFKGDFSILLEAPTWVKIDKSLVTLEPGAETQVIVTVNPTGDVKATDYSIVLKAQDANKLESSDSLSLKIVSQEECYKPSVSSEKDSIIVPKESPATLLFTIENDGLKSSDYVIELSGTAARFSLINPSTISLEPGKAQTLYLYVFPPTETDLGEYTLSLTARLKDSSIASKKDIKITITGEETNETGPFVPENETKEEPKTEGKSFFQKIWDFIKSIFTKKTVEQKNETGFSENHPPKLLKNIPDIKIKSGEAFTVNLTKYFSDEDKDKLNFITIKPENLDILIKGNEITIVAPEDFSGNREITFYATDGKVMIASNKVEITVEPSEEEQETTEETETQPECNSYYYFDNENKDCDSKEFCGTYMYQGLEVFDTKEECLENLPEIENVTEAPSENESSPVINITTNESEEPSEEETKEVTEEPEKETTSKKSFFTEYRSYIILAIIVAIIIILVMSGLGKKILAFFEEEEPDKKKK